MIKLNDFLLLIIHLQLVVEFSQHFLLAIEASHLLSKLRAEHFIDHFTHFAAKLVLKFYLFVSLGSPL